MTNLVALVILALVVIGAGTVAFWIATLPGTIARAWRRRRRRGAQRGAGADYERLVTARGRGFRDVRGDLERETRRRGPRP